MNISSSVCWCNTWDKKTLTNVGPDVICLLQRNVVKFIELPTMNTSYFKAETVATGLYLYAFAGHNRFPFFAFTESVLRPLIYVYKYPELVKFNTLPATMLMYQDIRFSELDLLVAIGGYPDYSVCVFNFRTNTLILNQATNVPAVRRSFILNNSNLPTIVQFNRKEMGVYCYEMSFLEKQSCLHLTSVIDLGKDYIKSAEHFMTFGDDNGLYVVNDYGQFSQIDIACFLVKRRWSPNTDELDGHEKTPHIHMLTAHKQGFLISSLARAYYIKRRGNTFSVEWIIDQMLSNISFFVSNANGELYAEGESGCILKLIVEENEANFVEVVSTGEPVRYFRLLQSIKDESVLTLQESKVTMFELHRGLLQSKVEIPGANCFVTHRTSPLVAVGTSESMVYVLQYEKASSVQIVYQLQCETYPIVSIDFVENCICFQDTSKALNIVNVELRPVRLTHYLAINEPDLLRKGTHILTFRLVEGPRLLVFLTRDPNLTAPVGYATEMWVYNWGRDKRLHRREFVLPQSYIAFCIVPSASRGAQVDMIAAVKDSNVIDQYVLTNRNDLQWTSSIKTQHYGFINGMTITKNLLTWGVDGVIVHFRTHKRSKKPYMISRYVKLQFRPKYLKYVREAFNSKYLMVLHADGHMRVMRLPSIADNARENVEIPLPTEEEYHVPQTNAVVTSFTPIETKVVAVEEFTRADYFKHDRVFAMIAEFAAKVSALIDYDMEVTGKTQGIFKKFCFNYEWLDAVTKEAQKLCALERASLERAIQDQSRIRDWIMRLVTQDAITINYKVRSIFADANFENFAMPRKTQMDEFDKYRFYDLQDHMRLSLISMEEIEEAPPPAAAHKPPHSITDDDREEGEEEQEEETGLRILKPYVVEGPSVYEHVMAPIFQLQDKNLVTSNQIFNDNCKYRVYLTAPLKQEFNKFFHEAQQMKQETIDSVLSTNSVLYKIYSNMNIMLRLLHMEMFDPPELSVPELTKDEVVPRIMEVDDSEIKAINRRRKKTIDMGGKRGRLLLWSVEFWERALIVMMDGVIEKLWEEEIKKDIPVPEFMLKKQPHEYTLEDQKIFRAYEEAVRQLGEDRRKYLRILHENEGKTLELKTQQILKLNKRVAELMLLKLDYDFAIKQNRIRMLNLKNINLRRVQLRKRINMFRKSIDKLNDYLDRYMTLAEYWEKGLADVRVRLEAQQSKDRAVERQFRSNYLNTVPHASHEMNKLFKKRPKLPAKVFNSTLVCLETSHRLAGKLTQRIAFPLPHDVYAFLTLLEENDMSKHCPQQVDAKSWEVFTKLRRQKVESELRLKAIGYQLADCQAYLNNFTKEVAGLKESKVLSLTSMDEATQQYLEVMRNMTLQLTITLGQVEVSVMGSYRSLSNSVLMHMDDINEVNQMIKDAGNKKIKAMQRVALFRRQVIFKEWEHKLYKANIAYLKYMLDAIEKCKVTIEFLNILRSWDKVRKERQKYMAAGAIERVIEQKIAAFKKHIERVNIKIDIVKAKTLEIKRESHAVDSKIDRLKVDVTFQNTLRDTMMEERRTREQRERMAQIKSHRYYMEKVRRNYAHVLELQTILELLRLRTYPTLGPPLPACHPPVPEHILSSVNNQ